MRIILRADGDASIGTGHVMRMLALAQAWDRHGSTVLVVRSLSPSLADRARALGVEVVHVAGTLPAGEPASRKGDVGDGQAKAAITPEDEERALVEIVRATGAAAMVVDGYHVPPRLQQLNEVPVFLVDDHGRTGWQGAAGVIDGNLGADPQAYPQVPALLGPRYSMLRPSLQATPPATRPSRSLLITLGGGAPPGLVRTILEGIRRVPSFHGTLVLGPTQQEAEALAAEGSAIGLDVRSDVPDLAPLLTRHAWALVAGGTTVLEAAAAGTPVLALSQADNQRPVVAQVVANGIGRSLGEASALRPEDVRQAVEQAFADDGWRDQAAIKARHLVDGRGARRVCTWIRSRTLTMRPPDDEDRQTVLAWANDPVTRSMSFRTGPIAPEEHDRWWRRTIGSPDVLAFIAEQGGRLGFVWLRREASLATISVNVSPERRGGGWGSAMIRAATDQALQAGWTGEVWAWTKPENHASRSAFLDADFDLVPDPPNPPHPGAVLFKRTLAAEERAHPGTRHRP